MKKFFTAFSKRKKNRKEKNIEFKKLSENDIAMNELSQNGLNKIPFCVDGKSDFQIVIKDNIDKTLYNSVKELKDVIYKMTSYDILIVNENEFDKNNHHYISIDTALNNSNLDEKEVLDGYKTVINDEGITILGSSQEASRNGVYGFIEDVLGCIFLTYEDTFIPTQKTIYLEKMDKISKPAMQWRDVYAFETVQGDWSAKIRLNGIDVSKTDGKCENGQYTSWGTWCHDCFDFLSPDEYFSTHPEYFSEFLGKRYKKFMNIDSYLCLTNPDVYDIVEKNLGKAISRKPNTKYWDFSGNDNPHIKGCGCANCQKADIEAGGTGMGSLLPFLNKLAKAYPDKYISTLAYTHTLKAPKNIKAEPNVVIKLCSMPGDQASSYLYGENKNSKQFKDQVEEWSKVASNIVVWDYVVDFKNLLLPFPNFGVQVENQKFYEENNVSGIFHQASREKNSEFASLRAYVLSRLMWEGSSMDLEKCVSRYIKAYFGDAAPMVIDYMNISSKALYDSNNDLGLYDELVHHKNDYLSKENIAKYNSLLNDAKLAVKGQKVYEDRLDVIELPIVYANLVQPNISKTQRQEFLTKFKLLCGKNGITRATEWDTLESFYDNGLNKKINKQKLEVAKPYLIAGGASLGVLAISLATYLGFKHKK